MVRLTARSPKNNMAYLVNVKPNEQEVESQYPNTLKCILDAFERLAQYEDLEISLEQAKLLKAAFDRACEDAADEGGCPYDFCEYECEQCATCSNHLGEREDIGKDIECWKDYYLQKAQEKINS